MRSVQFHLKNNKFDAFLLLKQVGLSDGKSIIAKPTNKYERFQRYLNKKEILEAVNVNLSGNHGELTALCQQILQVATASTIEITSASSIEKSVLPMWKRTFKFQTSNQPLLRITNHHLGPRTKLVT